MPAYLLYRLPIYHSARLTVRYFPPVSISGHVGFNILLFHCALLVYHFSNFTNLSFVSFAILPFASICGPACLTFLPLALLPADFTILPTPSIGRLVVLESLVSLPILAMLVIPAMVPRLVSLGSLSGQI